jgi:hypothetical protein
VSFAVGAFVAVVAGLNWWDVASEASWRQVLAAVAFTGMGVLFLATGVSLNRANRDRRPG